MKIFQTFSLNGVRREPRRLLLTDGETQHSLSTSFFIIVSGRPSSTTIMRRDHPILLWRVPEMANARNQSMVGCLVKEADFV
jgi:hypothetical protein